MFLMYYQFRNEDGLKSSKSQPYKLRESNVISLVNRNRARVEPFVTIVDYSFERYTSDLEINMDPFGKQENSKTYEEHVSNL